MSAEAAAQAGEPAPLDWSVWRQFPVLDGGRIMPLDTFARSTVKRICGSERPDFLPPGGAAELLFSWVFEPQRWETIAFLPAAEPGLRTDLLEAPLRDERGRPLRYISPRDAAAAVKLRQRLEEIGNRQQQKETAGGRAELSATDVAAKELYEAYSAYRQLTFQPAAPVSGRDRFNEKLEGVVRDWSELESGLMSFFSGDKQGEVGKAAARAAEAVRKLTALAEKEEDAPLAEIEPLAASLQQSTAELAQGMSSLGDRMMKSPHALNESQARGFRLMMQSAAARVEELARRSAAAHLALYDNGLSLRLLPALDPAALEADREPEDDAQPWIALPALLNGPDDVIGPYPPDSLPLLRTALHTAAEAYAGRDNPQRPQRFADAMNALKIDLDEIAGDSELLRWELRSPRQGRRTADRNRLSAQRIDRRRSPLQSPRSILLGVGRLPAGGPVAGGLAGGLSQSGVLAGRRGPGRRHGDDRRRLHAAGDDYALGPGHKHVRDNRLRRPVRRPAGHVVRRPAAPLSAGDGEKFADARPPRRRGHILAGPADRLLRPRVPQGNSPADARAAEQLVAGRSRHDHRRRLRGGGLGLGRGQHRPGLLLAGAISAGQAAEELPPFSSPWPTRSSRSPSFS